jgi:hypothetical protein
MENHHDQPGVLLISLSDSACLRPQSELACCLQALASAGLSALMDAHFILCLTQPGRRVDAAVAKACCARVLGDAAVDWVTEVQLPGLLQGQPAELAEHLGRHTPAVGNFLRFMLMDMAHQLLDATATPSLAGTTPASRPARHVTRLRRT